MAPAGTNTELATVAAGLFEARAIDKPPTGAGLVRTNVSVTTVVELPLTVVGESVIVEMAGALTVSALDFVTLLRVAEMTAEAFDVTATVVVVNEADFEPWLTVTDAGTVAAELLLERFTTTPPAGALPVSVIVPTELIPPATLVGLNTRLAGVGAATIRLADLPIPSVVVIVAVESEATGLVEIVNVATF